MPSVVVVAAPATRAAVVVVTPVVGRCGAGWGLLGGPTAVIVGGGGGSGGCRVGPWCLGDTHDADGGGGWLNVLPARANAPTDIASARAMPPKPYATIFVLRRMAVNLVTRGLRLG